MAEFASPASGSISFFLAHFQHTPVSRRPMFRPGRDDYFKNRRDTYLDDYEDDVLTEDEDDETELYTESEATQAGAEWQRPSQQSPSQSRAGTIIKEGYLLKEGKVFKTWHRRYFVLKDQTLSYFEKKGGKLKGSFKIDGCEMTEAVERKLKACFKISTASRVWYLQAKDDREMFDWIDAIRDYGGAIETLPDLDPKIRKKMEEQWSDLDEDDAEEPPALPAVNAGGVVPVDSVAQQASTSEVVTSALSETAADDDTDDDEKDAVDQEDDAAAAVSRQQQPQSDSVEPGAGVDTPAASDATTPDPASAGSIALSFSAAAFAEGEAGVRGSMRLEAAAAQTKARTQSVAKQEKQVAFAEDQSYNAATPASPVDDAQPAQQQRKSKKKKHKKKRVKLADDEDEIGRSDSDAEHAETESADPALDVIKRLRIEMGARVGTGHMTELMQQGSFDTSDYDYNSDEEMFNLLQDAQEPPKSRPSSKSSSFALDKQTVQSETAPRVRANAATQPVPTVQHQYPDLFNFFVAESEGQKQIEQERQRAAAAAAAAQQQQEQQQPQNASASKDSSKSNDQSSSEYLDKVLKDISVIGQPQSTKLSREEIEEMKEALRRQQAEQSALQGARGLFTEDDESEQLIKVTTKIPTFEEYQDLIEYERHSSAHSTDDAHDDLSGGSGSGGAAAGGKASSSSNPIINAYNAFFNVFKNNYNSWFVYALFSALVFIVVCGLVTMTTLAMHEYREKIVATGRDRDSYISFVLSENIMDQMQLIFSRVNQGFLNVIGALEGALSETGALAQSYFQSTKLVGSSNTGHASPLFLSGYMGRVLQLSSISAVVYGLASFGISIGIISAYGAVLGKSTIGQQGRHYLLMRGPSLVLYYLWGVFQGTLFGVLHIWDWFFISLAHVIVFISMLYLFVNVIPDSFVSMAMLYDLAILVCFIGAFIAFIKPSFRSKHKIFNFRQDRYTIARHFRMSALLVACNLFPVMVIFMNNCFAFNLSPAHMYAALAVNIPSQIFVRASDFFNAIALVVGARCVKRQQLPQYLRLLVKAAINSFILCIAAIVLFLIPQLHEIIVRQVVGEEIKSAPGDPQSAELVKLAMERSADLWYMALVAVPLAILHNLYLTFVLTFQGYYMLLVTSALTNLFIAMPTVLISSLWKKNINGAVLGLAFAQAAAIFFYALYVHGIRIPLLRESYNKAIGLAGAEAAGQQQQQLASQGRQGSSSRSDDTHSSTQHEHLEELL